MNTSLYVRSWLGSDGASAWPDQVNGTVAPPYAADRDGPGGPRARLGRFVRVDVAAQRLHRPARRRRPRGDRRRPARPRHRTEAARSGGVRRPDRPDRRRAPRRSGRRGRVLARRADAAADRDRRARSVPPPRARRDRPQRVRARRRGDGADHRRRSKATARRPTTTSPGSSSSTRAAGQRRARAHRRAAAPATPARSHRPSSAGSRARCSWPSATTTSPGPADALVDALPDARYVALRNTDHFATPESFAFIDAVLDFLDAVPA